jgi:hypothetical protein
MRAKKSRASTMIAFAVSAFNTLRRKWQSSNQPEAEENEQIPLKAGVLYKINYRQPNSK